MLHQIYIVKQMNVCRDYNGNRGEQTDDLDRRFETYVAVTVIHKLIVI